MPLEDLIAKVEARLDTLETKPSSPKAVQELLTRLDTKIRSAQEKGYSSQEIVELIIGCGLEDHADTLRKTLVHALEPKRKSRLFGA